MSLPAFIGTTTNLLWQQATINNFGNSRPPEGGWNYSDGDGTNIRVYNPSNQIITWSTTPIPSVLNNLTLSQLLALSVDSNFTIRTEFTFTVTAGSQTTACFGVAKLNFDIFVSGGSVKLVNTDIAALGPVPGGVSAMVYPFGGQFPTFVYDYEDITTVSDLPNFDIKAIAWNDNFDCDNYPASNMTISAVMKVTLLVTCQTSAELSSNFCTTYCLDKNNLTTCFPQYFSFCLNSTDSNGAPNIFTNTECQDFFKTYIEDKGPDSRIDNILQNYCPRKYAGFEDLLNSGNQKDIELCACNLDPQLYNQLRTSLINLFPGYASVSEDSRCLFPQCVDSPYKNTNTTAICQIPNCLNIANITNNGQVGGITIIQGATGCGNITGQGGTGTTGPTGPAGPTGTNPPGQKSWWEKNWLWVVLGIGILIVFIVIMLIVIAGESNKKKPQVKLERDFV